MGSLQAMEMAEILDLDTALSWHLSSNHFPPVPLTMVQACKEAIWACNGGDADKLISLPEGVGYRGLTAAPAWAIVKGHHLAAWLEDNEDED